MISLTLFRSDSLSWFPPQEELHCFRVERLEGIPGSNQPLRAMATSLLNHEEILTDVFRGDKREKGRSMILSVSRFGVDKIDGTFFKVRRKTAFFHTLKGPAVRAFLLISVSYSSSYICMKNASTQL